MCCRGVCLVLFVGCLRSVCCVVSLLGVFLFCVVLYCVVLRVLLVCVRCCVCCVFVAFGCFSFLSLICFVGVRFDCLCCDRFYLALFLERLRFVCCVLLYLFV